MSGNLLKNAPWTNDYYLHNQQELFTELSPAEEILFKEWCKENGVPYDPNKPADAEHNRDYDMRGFFKGLLENSPMARTNIDPNDSKLHFTDYWKTPYHETFSRDSKFASPTAPWWTDRGQLVSGTDNSILFNPPQQVNK